MERDRKTYGVYFVARRLCLVWLSDLEIPACSVSVLRRDAGVALLFAGRFFSCGPVSRLLLAAAALAVAWVSQAFPAETGLGGRYLDRGGGFAVRIPRIPHDERVRRAARTEPLN